MANRPTLRPLGCSNTSRSLPTGERDHNVVLWGCERWSVCCKSLNFLQIHLITSKIHHVIWLDLLHIVSENPFSPFPGIRSPGIWSLESVLQNSLPEIHRGFPSWISVAEISCRRFTVDESISASHLWFPTRFLSCHQNPCLPLSSRCRLPSWSRIPGYILRTRLLRLCFLMSFPIEFSLKGDFGSISFCRIENVRDLVANEWVIVGNLPRCVLQGMNTPFSISFDDEG